ncbi:hypothetical protein [uncultured Amnibacterium sp.]|uniref:hypothetical protein n=1 Tax=uncultured Amnibacterium sp. TaxID=1631851 RepID=UPI0035CBBBDD
MAADATPAQHLEWLRADRDLDELQQRFPEEWERARARLLTASESGRPGYDRLIAELTPAPNGPRDRAPSKAQQVSTAVQRRMVRLALQSASDRNESGVEQGAIRFRRFDGLLLQRVLFTRGLVRKPVRMRSFRVAWRLAAQRDRLMPLVRPRGIWCFYSDAFVRRVAGMAEGTRAVEIAAGDGTLTRFLQVAGADVVATDDHSWSGRIDFPGWVERADAETALRRYEPQVVLCSWPPAGNGFEAAVLRTPSVRTYLVVLGADPREAGNPDAYRDQTAFDMVEDPELSALVLPPGRNRVVVFTRR